MQLFGSTAVYWPLMDDKVDKAMNSSLQTGSDMSPKLAFASGSPSCFSKACAVAGDAGHMKLHS